MATSATHTQQFALKWNNFHSNLSSGFHELFEAADMVDVTLAMDGKFLQAHKVVLSICSPYFKEMFKVNPCKHPIVILKGVGHEHMKDILEFMYLGEVSVLRENLTSFLRTAELLQVKGLTGDDSGESSSKEEEKFDCENEDDEEYSTNLMQFGQQFNPIDNHMGISSHYNPTPARCNPTPPPSTQPTPMPNINIPSANNKRSRNSTGSNGKRSKIDSNGNQSIPSKSVPTMPMTKTEEDGSNQVKKGVLSNQDSEPEYTDISNIKSERSSADEESTEKQTESRSGTGVDVFVDQDMFMYAGDSKSYVYCHYCERKFVNRYNLKVHVRDKHEDSTINLDCDVCGKTMRNRSCLRVHMYHHRKQVEQNEQSDSGTRQ